MDARPEIDPLLRCILQKSQSFLGIPSEDGTQDLQTLALEGLDGLYHWRASDFGTRPTAEHQERLTCEWIYQGMLAELGRLSASSGLEFIVFKGGALLFELYPPGTRTLSDLDLLVRPGQLPAAEALLLKAGYEKMPDYPVFSKGQWTLDLHENPHHQMKSAVALDLDLVWERSSLLSSETGPMRRLALEDEYAVGLLHAAKHGFSKLRWLVDLAVLAQRLGPQRLASALDCPLLVKVHGYAAFLMSQMFEHKLVGQPMVEFGWMDRYFLKQVLQRQASETLGLLAPGWILPTWRQRALYLKSVLFPGGLSLTRLQRLRDKMLVSIGLSPWRLMRRRIRLAKQNLRSRRALV